MDTQELVRRLDELKAEFTASLSQAEALDEDRESCEKALENAGAASSAAWEQVHAKRKAVRSLVSEYLGILAQGQRS
jgi:FKBP-type peptidyl-prolyl cis-trans isomerase (trigger factor)